MFIKIYGILYSDHQQEENMTLDEYLYSNHLTVADFAKMIGYDKSYISNVKNGKFRVSKRFSFLVFTATHGKVNMPYNPNERYAKKAKGEPIASTPIPDNAINHLRCALLHTKTPTIMENGTFQWICHECGKSAIAGSGNGIDKESS